MDNYVEQILKRKPQKTQFAAMAGAVVVILVGIWVILCVSMNIGIAVIAAGAFLAYVISQRMKAEYEYVFTNGVFDVAVIYNMADRKEFYSFDESQVLRILPYNSEKFQNELSVNAELSVKNITSEDREKQDSWYAFMLNNSRSDGIIAVILELSEKSLEHVKVFFKNKIET
ncbi:MAG: hypothetical protein K2G45_13395 [Lachnospiraceae bacterium]|nr:hypothetical protein [Lachnospiraceae bacterium]